MSRGDVPDDVAAIRGELETFLNKKDADGRIVGNSKYGVYAFYDYDGEHAYCESWKMSEAEFEAKLAAWKARGPVTKKPRRTRQPREQFEGTIKRHDVARKKQSEERGAMPWEADR